MIFELISRKLDRIFGNTVMMWFLNSLSCCIFCLPLYLPIAYTQQNLLQLSQQPFLNKVGTSLGDQ